MPFGHETYCQAFLDVNKAVVNAIILGGMPWLKLRQWQWSMLLRAVSKACLSCPDFTATYYISSGVGSKPIN